MVGPSSRVAFAHFKYVVNSLMNRKMWVTPQVVEDTQSANVEQSFHWQFSEKKVKRWNR